MGAVSGEGVKASIEGALAEAGITQGDVGRTVSTGYGRRMLDVADKNYTERRSREARRDLAVERTPEPALIRARPGPLSGRACRGGDHAGRAAFARGQTSR